jgi:hypothetical protein
MGNALWEEAERVTVTTTGTTIATAVSGEVCEVLPTYYIVW